MQIIYQGRVVTYANENGEPSSAPEFLRALRERLSLTQEQLARELAVSTSTLRLWEQGRAPVSPRGQAALIAIDPSFRPCRPSKSFRIDSTTIPLDIGVRAVRRLVGYSRSDLALALNVSANTVRNWENGTGVSAANLQAIYKVMK